MDLQNLGSLEPDSVIDTDLAIVGSGPAGLSIAREFIGARTRVLILESGELADDPQADALNAFESVGAARVMDPALLRNRIFGGSSHTWAGRCTTFDDVDFAARPWVPHSGWPFGRAALDPYFDRAAERLALGPNRYDGSLWEKLASPRPQPDVDPALLRPVFWQYSRDPGNAYDYLRFGPSFRSLRAPNIRVLTNATVTHIDTNAEGTRLEAIEVTSRDGRRGLVRAKALVLCAGGIDNTRVLLASNRTLACGVGNRNDMVGRFLMDHPRCDLGVFDPRTSQAAYDRFGLYRLNGGGTAHFYTHGLSLSPQLQQREGLLNCAAWLTENRAADDPWDAIKRLVGGAGNTLKDVRAVVSHPGLIARGLQRRFIKGQGVPHKLDRLILDCIVEQKPDPDSRLTLSERKDALGMPLPRLDWRISAEEKATAIRLAEVVSAEFKRIGLTPPVLADWVRNKQPNQAQFRDHAHPTGTTRMARDPKQGVVDEHCQVHGTEGIYIAGSSVFPSSGHANPTLMIVALAIRLADRLKQQHFH